MPELEMIIDSRPRTAVEAAPPVPWMGVQLRLPRGEEMSAYGVTFDTKGLAIEDIDRWSPLAGPQGLQRNDLILGVNGARITNVDALRTALDTVSDGMLQLRVIRAQKEITIELRVNRLTKP
jgi:S1-C subfamily serine protease